MFCGSYFYTKSRSPPVPKPRQIVLESIKTNISTAELCRKYNVHPPPPTLQTWRQQFMDVDKEVYHVKNCDKNASLNWTCCGCSGGPSWRTSGWHMPVPESQRNDDYEEFSYRFTHDTQKIEGASLTKKETYELLRLTSPRRKSPNPTC